MKREKIKNPYKREELDLRPSRCHFSQAPSSLLPPSIFPQQTLILLRENPSQEGKQRLEREGRVCLRPRYQRRVVSRVERGVIPDVRVSLIWRRWQFAMGSG
jgi:hypothetical protein